MRSLTMLIVLLSSAHYVLAQQATADPATVTGACTFQDGTEISVRYVPVETDAKARLPLNELWPASGPPMYLFTQSEVSIGGSELPVGAYSMYVIPDKHNWTLIINKTVTAGTKYDAAQDLARVPLEIGHLSQAVEQAKVAFGHIAPKQCNMRIYYGNTGAWTEFKEK